MNEILHQLHSSIAATLIPAMFEGKNIDDLLDLRDRDPFDSSWVSAHESLDENRLDAECLKLIDQIREQAYASVYSITQNPDAAAYVSDDFGLIATALALNHHHDFIESLWAEYQAGRFPKGYLPA